jgi:Xaa-Pro aminopeptidase
MIDCRAAPPHGSSSRAKANAVTATTLYTNRMRDAERIQRIQDTLREYQLDGLVCALPAYVLMLSGYWPVVGTSLAVASASGAIALVVPEDEEELAQHGGADRIVTYEPATLNELRRVSKAVVGPLHTAIAELGLERAAIGFEWGEASEPASYASMHLFGGSIHDVLSGAAPAAMLRNADDAIAQLAGVKTSFEVERIRRACHIAGYAYETGTERVAAGASEAEIASAFGAPLSTAGLRYEGVQRADGFVFCMSGPNSAKAGGAYARTRSRIVEHGDLVLVHCNSYADGYWTDITRTYHLGEMNDRVEAMYAAVFEARHAALMAIRPGVKASEVDAAARNVLRERGFAKEFTHGTGHGVGFAAISANSIPRIHPACHDLLQTGMVFNVEPAIYIQGFGGLRHCDMVAVTPVGGEVLTDFQTHPAALQIG